MTIKRDLLKVDIKFLTEETHAESALYAIEHRFYNVDGVIENDSHRIKKEDIDEEEKREVFLLCVVYDDYETNGKDITAVLTHELFNEDGITSFKIECLKSDELDATITEEEVAKYV